MPILAWLERHLEEAVCCVALAVVAVCVFLQVIMRYLFHTALQWSEEVAAMAMVWAVYMGAALCVRERFHIRIMAGVMLLPKRAALASIVLADLGWAAFSVMMLVISADYLSVLAQFTSRSPRLGIDQLYPQSILVIGYGLMLARLVQIYVIWLRDGRPGFPGMRPEHQIDLETGVEK
ncbi:TRAP transporter small permease [Rhodobium gokarnense]|uniref:TRAP transporter small permease protein n=1 Tax=Rhodobium gokarnense TaxID=364296 RepID=A0ABT3H695_9HYPH|nr:TRAP transporter small permease [Rhodobium gokarnense]MCW2305899.1 C4-dicarboxylate transporter DctQ subunit [Rhodobium gokarnense]